MSGYGYGFSGGSRGLSSSTVPSLLEPGSSSSLQGLSGTSSNFGVGSRNVSSTQLQDAAFAARVLGLDDFSSNLISSSMSSSSTSGIGSQSGSSSYGRTGLLGSQPQQISSLARDVPSSTRLVQFVILKVNDFYSCLS